MLKTKPFCSLKYVSPRQLASIQRLIAWELRNRPCAGQ
jgi:hypothetical protein